MQNTIDYEMNRTNLISLLSAKKSISCLLRAQALNVLLYDQKEETYFQINPKGHHDDYFKNSLWLKDVSKYQAENLDCYKRATVFVLANGKSKFSLSYDMLQAQLRKVLPVKIHNYCKGIVIENASINVGTGKINYEGNTYVKITVKLFFLRSEYYLVKNITDKLHNSVIA